MDRLDYEIQWHVFNIRMIEELPLTRVCPSLLHFDSGERRIKCDSVLVKDAYQYDPSQGCLVARPSKAGTRYKRKIQRYFELVCFE